MNVYVVREDVGDRDYNRAIFSKKKRAEKYMNKHKKYSSNKIWIESWVVDSEEDYDY